MKRCPITYEALSPEETYSKKGLRSLSTGLTTLEAWSGIAPPANEPFGILAVLPSPKTNSLQPDDSGTLSLVFSQDQSLLANLDITAKLFALFGVDVSNHGLIYRDDGKLIHFYRHPEAHSKKQHYPTFFFPLGKTFDLRECTHWLDEQASFPRVVRLALFRRLIAHFLCGSDAVLPESIYVFDENDHRQLAPAFMVFNQSLHHQIVAAPIAFDGKTMQSFNEKILFEEIALGLLELPPSFVTKQRKQAKQVLFSTYELIERCFLSDEQKEDLLMIIDSRWSALGF